MADVPLLRHPQRQREIGENRSIPAHIVTVVGAFSQFHPGRGRRHPFADQQGGGRFNKEVLLRPLSLVSPKGV